MIPYTHRECVLLAFLQGHSIPTLAAHHKLPILSIAAYLNSPEVAAIRATLNDLAAYQAELTTTHARIGVILKLQAVMNGQEIHPDELRAACALLKGTPKAAPNRPASAPSPSAHSQSAKSAESAVPPRSSVSSSQSARSAESAALSQTHAPSHQSPGSEARAAQASRLHTDEAEPTDFRARQPARVTSHAQALVESAGCAATTDPARGERPTNSHARDRPLAANHSA